MPRRNNQNKIEGFETHSCRDGRNDESMLRKFSMDRVLRQYPPNGGHSGDPGWTSDFDPDLCENDFLETETKYQFMNLASAVIMIRPRYLIDSIIARKVSASEFSHSLDP